jgi:transcriptional regulator with GAF, ATPase, and Fis domain
MIYSIFEDKQGDIFIIHYNIYDFSNAYLLGRHLFNVLASSPLDARMEAIKKLKSELIDRYQKRRASLREEKKQQKRETLRTFLIDVFEQNGYNKKNTAKVLGITPRQLTGMCRKHDIDHENWKIARSYYIKENRNEKQ